MPHYDVIKDFYIDSSVRNLAALACKLASHQLGIKEPALHWIIESRFGSKWFDDDVNGYCGKDGQEIFICRDRTPFSIASAVIHECRHVYQIRQPKWFSREINERDARLFEYEFWNGAEKRSGDVTEITRILMNIQIQACKAAIRSAAMPTKRGLVFSAHYPAVGRTKVIAPSDEEIKDYWLRTILND